MSWPKNSFGFFERRNEKTWMNFSANPIYICVCTVFVQSLRLTLHNPRTVAHKASLSFAISQSLLKLVSVESVMPSNHLTLSPPFPPALNLPQHQGLSSESALHIRWPKYWSCSFSISPAVNIQDWSPLGWTGWISLQSKRLSRVFSNTTVQKHQFFGAQLSL